MSRRSRQGTWETAAALTGGPVGQLTSSTCSAIGTAPARLRLRAAPRPSLGGISSRGRVNDVGGRRLSRGAFSRGERFG